MFSDSNTKKVWEQTPYFLIFSAEIAYDVVRDYSSGQTYTES